jgi:hypothetical protein
MRRVLTGSHFLSVLAIVVVPVTAQAVSCPDRPSGDQFSVQALYDLNKRQWEIGTRPTGSDNHNIWIKVLEAELAKIPNIAVRSTPTLSVQIKRWDESRTALTVAGVNIPVAGPVPYSMPTGAQGWTSPLKYLPDQPITIDNAKDYIVVRNMVPLAAPYWFVKDFMEWEWVYPENAIDPTKTYEREQGATVPDLDAAAAAQAKGLVYLSDLPSKQIKGLYVPYQGIVWGVPAVYLGADESAQVRAAINAASTTDGGSQATITVEAELTDKPTKALVATILGASSGKIVIESHTDGVNGVWDNGPVAMIAMARYLAGLPAECRRKTVEFVFTTGHLYQHIMGGGAEQFAQEFDSYYDRDPSVVIALEHLGAREYQASQPRGIPGRELELSGLSELLFVAVSESGELKKAVREVVSNYRLERTVLWPGLRKLFAIPPHCSFGGEGTSYNQHVLPTVGVISAPWVLFMPSFGLESIDFELMQRQTLAFTDLVLRLDGMSQSEIAGRVPDYRRSRQPWTVCLDPPTHALFPRPPG